MKKMIFSIGLLSGLPFFKAGAAPQITNCISIDQFVKVELVQQHDDQNMFDLKIMSNRSGQMAESTFPTRENVTENTVVYTLMDSDFEMLSVDLASGQGKLSNGQFLSPKPYIEVVCTTEN